MKKYLEKFLASVLLGLTILPVLSFWLNEHFGFNMFYAPHWDELAKLQAAHAPINKWFYISVCIAIFLFIFGLYIIFKPRFRNLFKTVGTKEENHEQNHQTTATVIPQPVAPTVSETNISVKQPPKLNLPKNIAEIVAQQYEKQSSQPTSQQPTVYDSQLSELFAKANYLVKPNLTITGFTTNLFAIGTDELVWFGAVNCNINKFKTAANKLKSIFETTLEDVPITISAFRTQDNYTKLMMKHLYFTLWKNSAIS